MKTSTAHKLKIMRSAIRDGQKPKVRFRGDPAVWDVADVRNLSYAVELRLDKRAGTVVIDPDDILLVHVIRVPAAADDE